jgi:hypothetical protein
METESQVHLQMPRHEAESLAHEIRTIIDNTLRPAPKLTELVVLLEQTLAPAPTVLIDNAKFNP